MPASRTLCSIENLKASPMLVNVNLVTISKKLFKFLKKYSKNFIHVSIV